MLQLLSVFKLPAYFCIGVFLGVFVFAGPSNLSHTKANSQDMLSQLNSSISRASDLNVDALSFSSVKFKKDHDPNLYLILYNQNFTQARENSIKGLAAFEGITESQARKFIFDRDTSFIGIDPEDPNSVQTATQRIQQLNQSYLEERDLFQSLGFLQTQTFALELFTNNNLRDSTFDLVSDLNQIEKLLFGRNAVSQFGPLIDFESTTTTLANSGFGSTFQPITVSNPDTTDPSGPTEDDPNTGIVPPNSNSLACPIDPDLQSELSDFNEQSDPNQSSANETSGEAEATPELSRKNSITLGNPPEYKAFTETDTRCSNADSVFGNLFCFRVEEVRQTAGFRFEGEQYCVDCLTEQIANISQELNSASLIPQKLTGNFGEPAVCKKAVLSAFSLNVSFIPRPARSDLPLTRAIQEVSIFDTASNLTETVPKPTTQEVLSRASNAVEDTLNAAVSVVQDAQSIVTNDDLSRTLNDSITPQVETVSEFASQLNNRLVTFSQNFTALNQQITQLQSTFNQITQKPACSAL